jgi:frataxin-like iron-binding protein CyaY
MPTYTSPRKSEQPDPVSKGWRGLRVALRALVWIPFCILVIVVLSFLLHTFCHFCPFTFSVVRLDQEIPMEYGYVFSPEPEPEWKDKIAFGGCMVMPISTICPRCNWPMRYCDPTAPDAMPDLDVNTLFATSLNEQAQASLLAQVDRLKSAQLGDAQEAIIAGAIGESDLWLASRNQGLHRMDLETGAWTTDRDGQPWRCFVKAIAITGNCVRVEYCPFSAPTFFQTAETLDGGHTWRLTSGPLPLLP